MLTHHYRIIALICALAFCPGLCPPARPQAAPQGTAAAQSNEHDCVNDITVGVNVSPHVINPLATDRSEAIVTLTLTPCATLPADTADPRLEVFKEETGRVVYAENRTVRVRAGETTKVETTWRPGEVLSDGRYFLRAKATRTANGSRVMGQSFSSSASSVGVRVEAHDPDGESAASIELWGGRLGSTQSPQRVASTTANDTLDASIPRKPAGQEWYYYVKIRQADGDRIRSSPLWIRWN